MADERAMKGWKPGWTWANNGSMWHIDHVRPIASFDLTKREQLFQCFHYSNLQPLEATQNIRKSSNWNGRKWKIGERALCDG